MKDRKRIAVIMLCAFVGSSLLVCKTLPPGQVKDITGDQNASNVAPGHTK